MNEPRTTTGDPLLVDDDRTELRERWLEIEEWFVDEPTDAVRRADDLVADAVDRIGEALAARRTALRGRWESLDDATTEQLRSTLHDYEVLLAQLASMRAPAGWQSEGARPTSHGRPTFPRTGDRDRTVARESSE